MFKVSSFVAIYYVFYMGVRCHGSVLKIPGGIIASAFTGFTENQKLNYKQVPTMAQWYAQNNITNILLFDWFGEAPSVPLRERQAYLKAWTTAAEPYGLNIMIEVGLLPLRDTLILAQYCSKLNVKAITVFPQQVFQAQTIDQAIDDLLLIYNAAPNIPMVFNELISTNPKITTVDMFLAASKRVPSFAGVITNPSTAMDIKAVTSLAGKVIWTYDNQYLAPALMLRLNATVTTAPNLFPRLVFAIEDAIYRCDIKKVQYLQSKLSQLIYAISNLDGGSIDTYARSYLENQKAAAWLLNGMNLGARVPLQEANETTVSQIASNLRQLGVRLNKKSNSV